MEFGPRALGARSILADARNPKMQSLINQKIKYRESFRPFAPVVLREQVDRYFEMRPYEESPYMLLVAPVCEGLRSKAANDDPPAQGLDKLKIRRSAIPAVTHVDYSARVQTVDESRNPLLHQLLTRFHARTGSPVMINTSFNVRGEPIVCTPEEALRCFQMTDMDALVLGRHILLKRQQDCQVGEAERREHLARIVRD
jgi:carbamoyltransferase